MAALLVLWELIGRATPHGPTSLPLPSEVARLALTLAANGELATDAAQSALRVAMGGGVGAAAGVLAGVALAAGRAGRVVEVPLALLRPIPPIAWIPLTLLWFGVSELQQLAILAGATFHVVAPATADAVRAVPAALVHAARNLGARPAVVAGVRLHAALPGVAAAVRHGLTVAWFVLVAAEFVSAPRGLGVLMLEGRDLIEPARTFVSIAALALAAALTDAALAAGQRRWTAPC